MSIQYDTQRLLREYENEQTFIVTTNNDELSAEVPKRLRYNVDYEMDENNRYIFSEYSYQKFQELADDLGLDETDWYVEMSSDSSTNTDYSKHQKNPNYYNDRPNDYFSRLGMEEMSSTPAGAFLPGLDVPEKKYKYGYTKELKENVNSGYKKVKGFRPGHSKINIVEPKDLWNLNEIDETDLKIGDEVRIDKSVNKSWKKDGFGKVISIEGDQIVVDITNGGGSTYPRAMTFHKDKISLKDNNVDKADKEMKKEPIKEGLKSEIKVRSKKQQLQQATRLANNKLKEINTILEFANEIKTDLNEIQCESCSRMMESMKKTIAEVYKKMKNL